MVYELTKDIQKAWERLKVDHGAIGIMVTPQGKLQLQLSNKKVFDGINCDNLTITTNGLYRSYTKTFSNIEYILLESEVKK